MAIFRSLAFRSIPIALGLACSAASFAAVSVTDTRVTVVGGNLVLSYRLNQAATSVQVATTGGTSVPGPTAKGLNQVNLPLTDAGKSVTITASAAAASGPGGAAVISAVKLPDNRASASSTALVAVDVNKRAGSPFLGTIYLPTGFGQSGQKYLWAYGSDGTLLKNKNLSDIYTSFSWPFAMGVAQNDPQDRVLVANRSLTKVRVLFGDLAVGPELTGTYNTPGMAVTPNTNSTTEPWNIYLANNKSSGIYHWTSDLATVSTEVEAGMATSGSGSMNAHDFAIDPTNSVLFKAQVEDGGAGSILDNNVSKWLSADAGASWFEDTAWNTGFVGAVATDLANAGSTLTTGNLVSGGVALDAGFNPNNQAASSVWVAVSGGTGATLFSRIYKVNASTGAIQQTIDLTQIPTPEGGVAFNDKSAHFIETDHVGNLVITLNIGAAMNGQTARYFAILAPNSTTASQAALQLTLIPPPFVQVSVDRDTVGNTGTGVVKYTATVTDFKGIAADNVKVYADLTAIGGDARQQLTAGPITGEGTIGEFTWTHTVPNTVNLANSGAFDLPFTAETGSGNSTARLTQHVYNAYVPSWSSAVDGVVVGSVANGKVAYAATATGKVYAFDAATGAPVAAFNGGSVNVGSAIQGQIVYELGRIIVPTSTGVVILNGGNGSILASNTTLGPVKSVAASPLQPGAVYAASGNRVVKLNISTGAVLGQSQDFGAAVNRIGIGPTIAWSTTEAIGSIVVGGTQGDTEGKNGKIFLLQSGNLQPAFTDSTSGGPILYTDANGPVKSAPAFGVDTNAANLVAIGGASGLWGINADTGEKLAWTAGSGGGANVGGNPYTPGSPVDANPVIPTYDDGASEGARIAFATSGLAGVPGQAVLLASASGERVSFGGYPAALTQEGSGFAEGAGLLAIRGLSFAATPADMRAMYLGSNGGDQRFYGLETLPDDIGYAATAARKHTFVPGDTQTFPGTTAGAFNVPPALAGDIVAIGSSAGAYFGFPSLTTVKPWVATVSPSNGATGVAQSATVTVTLSADADPMAINNDNVKLFLNGTSIDATVMAGVDPKVITITPSAPLQKDATYVVWIGKALAQPFSSAFFTGVPQLGRADVEKILRIAGGTAPVSAADKARYDLDGDGAVTLKDAARLNRQINNL